MPADQLKVIKDLLDRGFGSSTQQMDIVHSISNRPPTTCLMRHYGCWSRTQAA